MEMYSYIKENEHNLREMRFSRRWRFKF